MFNVLFIVKVLIISAYSIYEHSQVNQLTENNERSYETRHGGFFSYKGQGKILSCFEDSQTMFLVEASIRTQLLLTE